VFHRFPPSEAFLAHINSYLGRTSRKPI